MVCYSVLCVTTGLLGLVIFLVICYWYRLRNNHYWKTKNVKSNVPVPFVGNYFGIFVRGSTFFQEDQKQYKKFGRIFGGYDGFSPAIFVAEPELIRSILVKDFHCFADRRNIAINDPILSIQIPVSTGEQWKRVRSVITPAFSTGKIKKMVSLILEGVETNLKHFVSAAESGETIDAKSLFNSFGLDVIASIAFGTQLVPDSDLRETFIQKVSKIHNRDFPWRMILTMFLPGLAKFLGIRILDAKSTQFFVDLSKEVISKRRQENVRRNDLMQLLLDAEKNSKDGRISLAEDEKSPAQEETEEFSNDIFKQYSKNKSITTDEFIAQCILFFFAGLDGVSVSLSMVAYHLALNPACQEKLLAEVDDFAKKHPIIEYETLAEATYLEKVVSESFRMVPPGVRVSREATEDYKLGDTGITIPKGMNVHIPVYAMQHDPELFKDPETFDPERFSPENKDEIQPYTYLPFGAGPRHCLGMRFSLIEIKVCLLYLLRKVSFQQCSETDIPLKFYKGSAFYLPRKVSLKVVKRH